MIKEKKWQVAPKAEPEWFDNFPELNNNILQLLYNRGLKTESEIENFLNPEYSETVYDPFLFRDMKKAVERIWQAIDKSEKVVIFGDYDADGVCSSVMLADFFKNAGLELEVIIPHRSQDGYGLNARAVEKIIKINPKLLITLDCGSTNVAEVEQLSAAFVDVIIVDHHHELEETPKPFALLNCSFAKETYPTKNLAAGGMTYKLIQALSSFGREKNKLNVVEGWEKWYLDLAAVATVADMVPLRGENRTLVKYGLLVLNKTNRPGLKAIINLTGLKPGRVNERHLGFVIGPRINAAGRMKHALKAFDLLSTNSVRQADDLSRMIQEDNNERQKTTDSYLIKAKKDLVGQIKKNKNIVFVFNPKWNLGLVGLVAGRLLEEFGLPVLVMSEVDGKIKGSGRSIPTFNITEALEMVGDLLERFGGHSQACGFTLKNKKDLPVFNERLSDIAARDVSPDDLQPILEIDAEVELQQMDWNFYEFLEKFSPFGHQMPVPKFVSRDLEIVNIETVGIDNKHLRIYVKDKQGITKKAIAFGFGPLWLDKLIVGAKIDLVYEVDVNEWNGNRELQYKVVDLKLKKIDG